MARKIYGVLNKYGIQNRILGFTTDSVSNNNKTLTKPFKQRVEFTIGWMEPVGKSYSLYGIYSTAYTWYVYEFDQGEIKGWSYAIWL